MAFYCSVHGSDFYIIFRDNQRLESRPCVKQQEARVFSLYHSGNNMKSTLGLGDSPIWTAQDIGGCYSGMKAVNRSIVRPIATSFTAHRKPEPPTIISLPPTVCILSVTSYCVHF